jgi:hypothetical protein
MAPKTTTAAQSTSTTKPAGKTTTKKRKASALEEDVVKPPLLPQRALVVYTGQDVVFERVLVRTCVLTHNHPVVGSCWLTSRSPFFALSFLSLAGTSLDDVKNSIRKKLRLADQQGINLAYVKADLTERALDILDGQFIRSFPSTLSLPFLRACD